jgi:glycosyltransferase involved in cell wall biosynthesis
MRIALLTNIVPPYRLPVYRDLATTPGWALRVMVCAEGETGFGRAHEGAFERGRRDLDVEVVRGWSFPRGVSTGAAGEARQVVDSHVPLGALTALCRFRPDVIVSAELGARSAIAALYALASRTPLVIWSYPSRAAAAGLGAARLAWSRAVLARAQAVVGMGVQAREVLGSLGVPPARLFDAPNACDRESLEAALERAEPSAMRASLRATLGCRQRIALVVGRLVPAKGVRPLLAAWRRLSPQRRRDWSLLFVGDGPLAREVREAATALEPGAVVVAGSVPAASVVDFYAAADILVFPSLGDPWGLVVNEALTCGLPVVCSRLAGCADDLVRSGDNGWIFDPTDQGASVAVLAEALASPRLARLGERARETAKRFGPDVMANGLRRAIAHAASWSA